MHLATKNPENLRWMKWNRKSGAKLDSESEQASQRTKRVNSNNNHVPFNRTINILRGAHSCAGCCCCVYLLFKYCAMCRNGMVYRIEIQIIIKKPKKSSLFAPLSALLHRTASHPHFLAFMVSVFIAKCHTLIANSSRFIQTFKQMTITISRHRLKINRNHPAARKRKRDCASKWLWINRQQWQRKCLLREMLSILPCVKPQNRENEKRKKNCLYVRKIERRKEIKINKHNKNEKSKM